MFFKEIYYSSFTQNTIYSKTPKDIKELARVLKETKEADPLLRTIAIVIFRWKESPNETYINFKRLDFKKDLKEIEEIIDRYKVKVESKELF